MRDSASPFDWLFPTLPQAEPLSPESLWRSLRFFNLYRLILGGLLMFMATLFGSALNLSPPDLEAFFWSSASYASLVLVSVAAIAVRRPRPGWQLAFQMFTDITCITLL